MISLPDRLRALTLESLRRMRRERMIRTHGRDYAAAVDDGLMNISELCAYLDVTRPNVYYWIKSGKMSSTMIDGKLYFEPVQAKIEYEQYRVRRGK